MVCAYMCVHMYMFVLCVHVCSHVYISAHIFVYAYVED